MSKVSIIIPVYNVEKYLVECLESILHQDYDDYEVILINDGSTDGSLSIANKYISRFNGKLKVISQDNSGQSSARNKGIEIAVGDYLYFLDSDDYIDSNTLSLCMNCFSFNEVNVVFFDASSFFDNLYDNKNISSIYNREVEEGVYRNFDLLKIFMSKNYITSACCYMIKKETYINNRFPIGTLHEDNYYTTKLFEDKNAKSYVLNEALYNRRYRPDSIMTVKKTIKNVDGYFKSASLLYDENPDNEDIKKYAHILYNRAVDIVLNEGLKLTIKHKLLLILELVRKKTNIKIFVKLLFPKIIRLIRT